LAIPLGTTARQLEAIARWMLACVVVVSAGIWSTPSLAGWGAVTAAMLVTLVLWLLQRITCGERRMPVQAFHWALLIPAAILAIHLADHYLQSHRGERAGSSGALDMSLLLQIGLLGLGVLLSQSLLPRAAKHVCTLSVCGLAMMGGPLAAILLDPAAESMRGALGLLACAGIGVWLMPLWGIGRINQPPEESVPIGGPGLRWSIWLVAMVVAIGLGFVFPRSALLAAGLLGVVLLLAAVAFGRHRVMMLAGGAILSAGAIGGMLWLRPTLPDVGVGGLFGRGGGAFGLISAGDGGMTVLSGAVGWVGVIGLVGGLAAALVWMLLRAGRQREGDQGRAIVWAWAVSMATAALLATGGLFAPAMTVAAGFVWGMAPRALGRPRRYRGGWVLLAVMVGAMLAAGLSPAMGLVEWSVGELVQIESMDKWLHGASGLLLTLMLAWLLGAKKVWWGVVGIVLAAALGGAGEGVQQVAGGGRSVQWSDWVAHLAGVGVAAVLYGLCVLSRGCESEEAAPTPDKIDAYGAS